MIDFYWLLQLAFKNDVILAEYKVRYLINFFVIKKLILAEVIPTVSVMTEIMRAQS